MSIYVVFLGGYLASQLDMEQWKTSATKLRGDVTFDAFPYPDTAGSGDKSAVSGFKMQFDGVIKKIEDSGADTLFIVGHSSGCAIANELNSRLKGDHSHITLVDLDGFAPSADQIKKSSVQAWSAEGAGGKGKSLNWAKGHKKFIAGSATQEWSLHFSLVNTAATDAVTKDNYRIKGYAGCIANLCWLPKKT
jgi:hypothetical protein